MLLLLVVVVALAGASVDDDVELEGAAGLAPAVPGVRFTALTAEVVGRGLAGTGVGRTFRPALDFPDDLPDFDLDPFLLLDDEPPPPPPPIPPLDPLEHPLPSRPFLLLPILLELEQSDAAPNSPPDNDGVIDFMTNVGTLVVAGLTGRRVVGGETGLPVTGSLVGTGDCPTTEIFVGALLVGAEDVGLLGVPGAVVAGVAATNVGDRLVVDTAVGMVDGMSEGNELGWLLGLVVGRFVGLFVGRFVTLIIIAVGTACSE
jgi:hypothetical protein